MEINEKEIVANCQKGKVEDFSVLYYQYVRKIYKFIYYKVQHRETAEDLTSQTFIKALEKINSFSNEKSSFSTWVYAIARNNVIDHYRTKKNNFDINDVWDLKDNTDIERDTDLKRKLEKVEVYLKDLKPEQREIVMLRVWGDMSYREIAEATGKSEANCKMIFFRVIKKLKDKMPLELLLYFLFLKI
jgi:RNA polymerase sigma-70 factor (ECF subfamily)